MKKDLQKILTRENRPMKIDLQKRPIRETYERDLRQRESHVAFEGEHDQKPVERRDGDCYDPAHELGGAAVCEALHRTLLRRHVDQREHCYRERYSKISGCQNVHC